jgi:hypothetical protein
VIAEANHIPRLDGDALEVGNTRHRLGVEVRRRRSPTGTMARISTHCERDDPIKVRLTRRVIANDGQRSSRTDLVPGGADWITVRPNHAKMSSSPSTWRRPGGRASNRRRRSVASAQTIPPQDNPRHLHERSPTFPHTASVVRVVEPSCPPLGAPGTVGRPATGRPCSAVRQAGDRQFVRLHEHFAAVSHSVAAHDRY